MEKILDWLRTNPDVLGYLTAALIFLFTIALAARKTLGFFITLLFLLFSLLAGFTIAKHQVISDAFKSQEKAVSHEPEIAALCLTIPEDAKHWICPSCKHKNSISFVICQSCGWGQ